MFCLTVVLLISVWVCYARETEICYDQFNMSSQTFKKYNFSLFPGNVVMCFLCERHWQMLRANIIYST